MTTVRDLLELAATRLPAHPGGLSPRAEARFLLTRALGRNESWLLAHGDANVPDAEAARFLAWVARRAAGEPAHYIVGSCPFWGREFAVTPAVLIPRPETELLVQAALSSAPPPGARVLDQGTGSGCLAVTLALELPGRMVVATDHSLAALAVARFNARRLAAPVQLVAGDLGQPLHGGWNLLVANLPYVPTATLATLSPEVRDFEPRLALDGGADGLSLVLALLQDLPRLLAPGGHACLELGIDQAEAVSDHARACGLVEVDRVVDAGGIARVIVLARPA